MKLPWFFICDFQSSFHLPFFNCNSSSPFIGASKCPGKTVTTLSKETRPCRRGQTLVSAPSRLTILPNRPASTQRLLYLSRSMQIFWRHTPGANPPSTRNVTQPSHRLLENRRRLKECRSSRLRVGRLWRRGGRRYVI